MVEDYGYKYFRMLPQFVTTLNSGKKCSVELKSNNVKNFDFLSTPNNKPLLEYRKQKFKSGDLICISKYDLPFGKVYKSKFTQKLFDVDAIATRKPPTFTKKVDQDEILRGVVYQKELIKVL